MVKRMKTKKFLEELRDKTIKDLRIDLNNKKKELFNLRFQLATNQLDNPMMVNDVRKEIAQINTIIREKELAQK